LLIFESSSVVQAIFTCRRDLGEVRMNLTLMAGNALEVAADLTIFREFVRVLG